jgi:hypothetical protein
MFLRAEDIEEVVSIGALPEMTPEDMRRRIIFLERQVSRLQESVDLMYQVNQMSSSRFETMDDETLLLLYANIRDETENDSWSIRRILSCCEVFMKLGEPEVDRLNGLTDSEDAWQPFFELCLMQHRYVTTHPEFPIDVNLQHCRDLLSVGRDNLRTIATIFIALTLDKDSSYELLAGMAAADIDAFDTLVRQIKKRNPRGNLHLLQK